MIKPPPTYRRPWALLPIPKFKTKEIPLASGVQPDPKLRDLLY